MQETTELSDAYDIIANCRKAMQADEIRRTAMITIGGVRHMLRESDRLLREAFDIVPTGNIESLMDKMELSERYAESAITMLKAELELVKEAEDGD